MASALNDKKHVRDRSVWVSARTCWDIAGKPHIRKNRKIDSIIVAPVIAKFNDEESIADNFMAYGRLNKMSKRCQVAKVGAATQRKCSSATEMQVTLYTRTSHSEASKRCFR